ncbi:unnamed protein product, partial [Mesorhabditis spiculigera]
MLGAGGRLFVALFLFSSLDLALGGWQEVAVQGTILCDGVPFWGATVRLMERDLGNIIDPDDMYDETRPFLLENQKCLS